jgi:hypothetical protein
MGFYGNPKALHSDFCIDFYAHVKPKGKGITGIGLVIG